MAKQTQDPVVTLGGSAKHMNILASTPHKLCGEGRILINTSLSLGKACRYAWGLTPHNPIQCVGANLNNGRIHHGLPPDMLLNFLNYTPLRATAAIPRTDNRRAMTPSAPN